MSILFIILPISNTNNLHYFLLIRIKIKSQKLKLHKMEYYYKVRVYKGKISKI